VIVGVPKMYSTWTYRTYSESPKNYSEDSTRQKESDASSIVEQNSSAVQAP